jgi:hypothetical protein
LSVIDDPQISGSNCNIPAVPVPKVLEAMLVSAEVPAVDVPSTNKFPAACTEMFPALPDQNVLL